jgi:pyrroline-5-carboxylate reductase
MTTKTWGFLGCGNLAQALITGLIKKKILKPSQIWISDRDKKKIQNFRARTGVEVGKDNLDVIDHCKVILIATKPLDIIPVLKEISTNQKKKIVVSLAAGVSSKTLIKFCSKDSLFRVMANTPAMVQKGAFGIFPVNAGPKEKAHIFNAFGKMGLVIPLKNDRGVNVITSASASGVGFVFLLMEEFQKWIRRKGLSPKDAKKLTLETFLGSALLAQERSELDLSALRKAVTSKKGTTLAGIKAMQKQKVGAGLKSGLDEAFNRSIEIARELDID